MQTKCRTCLRRGLQVSACLSPCTRLLNPFQNAPGLQGYIQWGYALRKIGFESEKNAIFCVKNKGN